MLPHPESACFVISGYAGSIASVELDHAHDIIADLMDTVVRGLRPPFRIAKFEGDAVFVYALAEKSSAFVDRPDGGTRVEIRVAKPKPKDRAFLEQVGPEFAKTIAGEVATLRTMIKGAPATIKDEPPLPVSENHFLIQPVHDR